MANKLRVLIVVDGWPPALGALADALVFPWSQRSNSEGIVALRTARSPIPRLVTA